MSTRRPAFTLIELLVVIAIIGALMALLFPAIRAVQETARGTVCRNNLAEIGKGCSSHLATHGFYPTGGWGWRWAGDPERGFGINQGTGWMYNILPYIGESELHDVGKGQPEAARRKAGAIRVTKVVPLYCCPSRRRPDTYPYTHGSPYYNIDRPESVGRNDYAANGGDIPFGSWTGPATIAEGEKMSENDWRSHATAVKDPADTTGKNYLAPNGIVYTRSTVKTVDDGATCTYLAGEKHLNIDKYLTSDTDNDQGWDLGYDWDVNRWTNIGASPFQDDHVTRAQSFGGPHSVGVNMVFCDGHVTVVSFDVNAEVHRSLGNRKDGSPTDLTLLDQ